jgi:signal transduction histidine kinase
LPEHKKARWLEPRTLQENYEVMVDAHYRAKTELRQLQTALDYAQNAEIKRREMISNITHELKTPLAIIHSYAEGLKDGIAADKQEQYLNVILEESERMDGMVLEMLDLSRLEAGKVRLSSDRFSLLGLTRSIFDRLAPVSAEKNLQIEYYLVEEFDITADESRIGQVITNFATNAIKYTPEGGRIWIKVYRHREQTILCIENECAPLPDEALSKIWDSFYRAEASRTTKGTGLGLAIAKAIIELHGGTVSAQNTSTGVEFRCTLP